MRRWTRRRTRRSRRHTVAAKTSSSSTAASPRPHRRHPRRRIRKTRKPTLATPYECLHSRPSPIPPPAHEWTRTRARRAPHRRLPSSSSSASSRWLFRTPSSSGDKKEHREKQNASRQAMSARTSTSRRGNDAARARKSHSVAHAAFRRQRAPWRSRNGGARKKLNTVEKFLKQNVKK